MFKEAFVYINTARDKTGQTDAVTSLTLRNEDGYYCDEYQHYDIMIVGIFPRVYTSTPMFT